MMMKIVTLSVLFILSLRFNGAQNLKKDIDSYTVCSMGDTPELPCGTVDVTDNWQHIHIDCSVMNTLTITYSNYVGPTTIRTTEEIRLECSSQSVQPSSVTCRYTGTSPSGESDMFSFYNLSAANILPGSVCYVSGCYSGDDFETYVKTPKRNCTIPVAPSVALSATTTATQGNPLSLNCNPIGQPSPNVTWHKDNVQLVPNSRVSIDGEDRLVFSSVISADGGSYRCEASNSAGMDSATTTLTVRVPPTVTADSATVVTIEGNTVALACNATGDPVPVQTWSRNGSELTSGGQYQISSDGRELMVQGVTEAQDEGEFTCHASNVAGNDSATIMLSVQVLPLAVATPISQELSAGEIALFDCVTSGDPAPEVRWLNAMSVDVTSLSDPRIEVLTNGTLIISNLHASDQQQYVCEANSSIGRNVSTLSLLVTVAPSVVLSATTTATQGNPLSLDCSPIGQPSPNVTWYKDNIQLVPNSRVSIDGEDRLVFSSVISADGGSYRCEASNSAGMDSANTTLTVLVWEDAATVMNSYVVLFPSMIIPVSLILPFIVMLLIILVVLRCKKQQKARARHALFVLDDKDMVFNPNHTPPVCVHKPPLNFSHRKISMISVDLIQNLTHSDNMAVPVSFEKYDKTITTDNPGHGEPPHYMYAVQNSIKESDDVLMIPGNSTECNIPEQSVELPAMSSDTHSGSVMQLTSEAETSESTTHYSLNTQNNTLTQENSVEYGDTSTLQLGLTSVNNQIPSTGTIGDDDNIEPFTSSDYQPSKFNQSSIVASRPSDMIQLDQSVNVECNGVYSLSQSTNYIVLAPQKDHQCQQTSITSLADTNIMLEDNTMNVLDTINTSESPISGQHPPTSSTNDQLNIINERDEELDMGGCGNSGQLPPTSTRLQRDSDNIIELDSAAANISTLVVTASQEDALNFDSERGSMLSLDLTGDIPEPLKYLDQLEMNHNRTLSDNGYL